MLLSFEPAIWPGPPVAPYSYRAAVERLREYEGLRCVWRVAAGAALLASVPILAVGGFVAGAYLAGDLHRPLRVMLGAIVAIGLGQGAAYLWRRREWDRLIVERVWTYEQIDGPQDLNALVRRADFIPACRALRRAKLNPVGCTRMPTSPPDAPDLDTKLIVGRSACWHSDDAPELLDQIRACLRAAGIRARVGGDDIA